MKIPASILVLVFLSMSVCATGVIENFVIADGVVYQITGMRKGITNTRITTTSGEIVKIPNASIKSYRINGHQYDLLPMLDYRGDTLAAAFMELIAARNGSRLYRYCSNCNKYDPVNQEIAPMNRIYRYYVLKSGRLSLLYDEETTCKAMAFFSVRILK